METTDAFRARFEANYFNLLIKKGVDPSTARTRAKAKAAALPARIETPAAAAPAAAPVDDDGGAARAGPRASEAHNQRRGAIVGGRIGRRRRRVRRRRGTFGLPIGRRTQGDLPAPKPPRRRQEGRTCAENRGRRRRRPRAVEKETTRAEAELGPRLDERPTARRDGVGDASRLARTAPDAGARVARGARTTPGPRLHVPVGPPRPVFRTGPHLRMLYGEFRRVSRDGAQLQLHDDDLTALVEDDPVRSCVEICSYRGEVASMAWGVRDFVSTQVPSARPPVSL